MLYSLHAATNLAPRFAPGTARCCRWKGFSRHKRGAHERIRGSSRQEGAGGEDPLLGPGHPAQQRDLRPGQDAGGQVPSGVARAGGPVDLLPGGTRPVPGHPGSEQRHRGRGTYAGGRGMRHARRRYQRERYLFDAWAHWCERQWDESLGLPRVTWLAKLMQYGERMGVMRAASEHLPPDHSDAESVEQYMGWLKGACPPMHAALMARHRGICRERKAADGTKRGAE